MRVVAKIRGSISRSNVFAGFSVVFMRGTCSLPLATHTRVCSRPERGDRASTLAFNKAKPES